MSLSSLIIMVIFSYLLGSLSFAVIVSRFYQIPDPRFNGSGNPGVTNVFRLGDRRSAILALLGDFLKAFIPTMMASWILRIEAAILLVATASIVGHLFPLFYRFHGGKGVAPAIGALMFINPKIGLLFTFSWLTALAISRISAVAALFSWILIPLVVFFREGATLFCIWLSVLSLLIIVRHRTNIEQLYKKIWKK